MQTPSITTGDSMAVLDYNRDYRKQNNKKPVVTFNDIFETQDFLDTNPNSSVKVGESYNDYGLTENFANKDTLGSILGLTDQINAYKKRKDTQKQTATQGAGRSTSILGGSVV